MGLGDQYWNKKYFMDHGDVVGLFQKYEPRLWATPGRRFKYSNSNYAILAAIVEEVSGIGFDEFLASKIFKPLGMDNSRAYNWVREKRKPGQVVGYVKKRRRYIPAGGDYLDGVLGDKGVHSTVVDLFKFDRALYEGTLLRPETMDLAFQPGSPNRRGQNYGFGWRMKSWMPGLVYHFGWWRGFRTCFIRDMQAERTVILLSNQFNSAKALNYWNIYHYINRFTKQDNPSRPM